MTDTEFRILGRIEGKLDALSDTVSKNHTEQRETNQYTSKRLGALENWRWMLLGGFTVIAFLIKSL